MKKLFGNDLAGRFSYVSLTKDTKFCKILWLLGPVWARRHLPHLTHG